MTTNTISAQLQECFIRAHQAYSRQQYDRVIQELQTAVGQADTPFELENLYAVTLTQMRRSKEAAGIFQKWCETRPTDLGLLLNLAWCQMQGHNFTAAYANYQKALALDPNNLVALEWAGLAASQLQKPELALAHAQTELKLRPDHANTHYNIGASYQELGLIEEALHHYRVALSHQASHALAQSNAAYAQHFLGEISPEDNFKNYMRLAQAISARIAPYTRWSSACAPHKTPLRIGFISPDLHEHPVGFFLASLLEKLPLGALEYYAYSDDISENLSLWSQGLRQHFHVFHSTASWTDAAIAQQIHHDKIDILFDLNGWTRGGRLGVFAHKPAPVQLTWLGYFASTGLAAMDGIIADPYSAPIGEEQLYSEKVWRLPHTRLGYAPHGAMLEAPVTALPSLKNGYTTFGCFQNLNKITDKVLRTWGDIAKQAPEAHWRIQSPQLQYATSHANFTRRLAQAGIPAEQTTLVGKQSFEDYLESYAQVDILLDTFPYPGGTTTVEALWMGVPTLTLATPGMLGRQGSTLLAAANMDAQWVCHDADTYISRAVQYAQASEWENLAALRVSLREKLGTSPIFDTQQFAQNWLSLIRSIWAQACTQKPW